MSEDRYPEHVTIYRQVVKIMAVKTVPPFSGGRNRGLYDHDFSTPPSLEGLGVGTIIRFPSGKTMILKRRAGLIVGPRHTWGFRTHRAA